MSTSPLESRLRRLKIATPPELAARARTAARTPRARAAPSTWQAPRRRVLGLAAAGAVALGGLMLAQVVWTPLSLPGRPEDAHAILLAAARSAAAQGGSGRYWRNMSTFGSIIEVGDAGNRYKLVQRSTFDVWTATAAGDESVSTVQQLGAQPWTESDRQAWLRAGSPTHWPDPSGKGAGDLSGTAAPPVTFPADSQQFEVMIGVNLSLAQLRGLPADATALRGQLDAWYRQSNSAYHPGMNRDDWTFQAIYTLLRYPISGPVRGGLLQVLATMPRVTALGDVKDDTGRPGKGVAFTASPDPTTHQVVQSQLVLDPSTGVLLGERDVLVKAADPKFKERPWAKPGDEVAYWVMTSSGYTDQPAPPPNHGKG